MVDSPLFELFQDDSVDKQLKIEFDGGVITNEELHSQEFELSESLCSESELTFGSCEASSIKFKISNIFTPLKDKWLTVSMTLDGNTEEPFLIGKYKVYSDVPTADRRYREVSAYDAMYDIINADVADWYNAILPNEDSTVTLKQFRDSFMAHFDLEQEEIELVNDDMVVEKTVEPSEISGKDVITAICEINGCFGHIGRDGKFKWIYLPQAVQGLYPANDLYPDHAPDYIPYQQDTGHLYPQDPKSTRIGKGFYISCEYESFITKEIKKLQIRQEENDIGCIYGIGDNCYIIQDNFLVYGKGTAELERIAENIYSKISGIVYRPFAADCKGNLCFEVGDPVRFPTTYEIVESYILTRTLKGIQALRDDYSAEGVLEYEEKVNSIRNSIIQLKGKTNTLTRTIEETNSRITDVEAGLSTRITQNAKDIILEAQRATAAEENLSASIKVNADNITAEVTRATSAEGELSSQISVNAQQISLKVSKDSIISEINQTAEKVAISAQKIDLNGLVNADELVSKYATVNNLNSVKVNVDELDVEIVNIAYALNAAEGRIGKIEADYISADIVSANYAKISDLNAVNAKFNNLNADNITSGTLSADRIDTNSLTVDAANITGTLNAKQIGTGAGAYTPQWLLRWTFTNKPTLNVTKVGGVVTDVKLEGGMSELYMLTGIYDYEVENINEFKN